MKRWIPIRRATLIADVVPGRGRASAVCAAIALTAGALTGPTAVAATGAPNPAAAETRPVCPPAEPGFARCFAEVRTDVHAGLGIRGAAAARSAHDPSAAAAALPPGYGPADLAAAYKLPATGGAGQTVALVDAGDDAGAEADLDVYRATYALPACTTADGCFRKVDETGQAAPLPSDQGWDTEIALDLDMVSAACPGCHILLVEADTASLADLGASVGTAVALGATEVSNSYGTTENNALMSFSSDYAHPGVALVAAAGDSGYGIPSFPAVLSTVTAVGGTTLNSAPSTQRGWTETAWQGTSSGCSAYVAKPSWQHDEDCPGRTVADVAADADPDTGPAVYDSESGGWLVVGGTSASSPYIAGVIALAGNPGAFADPSRIYAMATDLFDVVGGGNVEEGGCGRTYLCKAVKGYDGPTGNGTPDGIAAF